MDLNANKNEPKYKKSTELRNIGHCQMDGWFQMDLSRSTCKRWPSIISLALTSAEKWTLTQKL